MGQKPSPVVSVIIPTYNRAQVVSRAIQSVLAQTYLDFELIVVDDGSTDNTEEVVGSFNDSRIRYLCHEQNRGVSAARNTGIKAANGDYIAFQDSDDEWLPEKLERQMELFARDNTMSLGLVTCGAFLANKKGNMYSIPQRHILNYEELLYSRGKTGIGTIRLVVKRELAGTELYFDEGLPAHVDWDFALRLSKITKLGVIPEPLVRIYRTEGPYVYESRNVLNAKLMLLNKYSAELQARPKMLGRHHERIGIAYCYLGDIQNSRKHLKQAIQAYPYRPFAYCLFVSSLLGRLWLRIFLRIHGMLSTFIRQIQS